MTIDYVGNECNICSSHALYNICINYKTICYFNNTIALSMTILTLIFVQQCKTDRFANGSHKHFSVH